MANEEIQRAIESIVQQQAQYAARLEKDESRIAELQEYFKMLVELASTADKRQDTLGETMEALNHTMNELVQRTINDEARIARHEDSSKMPGETMVSLSHTMNQLVQRTINDEARIARHEDSIKMLGETMVSLSESMNHLAKGTSTDRTRVARLEDAFTSLADLAHKHV